ncbi:MAG: lanthionine synthetase LanC family protein [Bacillota bacterium]
MSITDPLVLPVDVSIGPVRLLHPGIRSRLGARDDDFAVSRPRGRAPAKIVDHAGAALLEAFRAPRRVSDVVLELAKQRGLDADALLIEAFPLLHDCFNSRFLVSADSADAAPILPGLEPGDRVGRWTVVRCVRLLADTEVYQARSADGAAAAIKLARGPATPALRTMFAREAAVLGQLGGRGAPRLLARGRVRGKQYIAMTWRAGVEPGTVFGELRAAGDRGRSALAGLATRLVAAYARLHARGVLHGDVCPGNVLIDGRGRVSLLDFGRACLISTQPSRRDPPRGFVPPFIDPELAAAVAADAPSPPLTAAGEQYALAALVYLLATGRAHRDFSLDRAAMLAEVGRDLPLPFSAHGVPPWPEFERVLQRAMSRRPEDRFLSVRAFAAALSRVKAPPASSRPSGTAAPATRLAAEFVDALRRANPLERVNSGAPTASVTYGMAGVACALYRLSLLGGDAAALAAADLWVTRALGAQSRRDAFHSPELGLTAASLGEVSPYHTVSGLHVVDGLIAQAFGDRDRCAGAVRRFVAAAAAPCRIPDLTLGRGGVLVGAALLLEALPPGMGDAAAALRASGDAAQRELWTQVPQAPAGPGSRLTPGIAHGWGGVLYATLRWSRSTGAPLPPAFHPRLAELAAWATPVGRGVHWPRRVAPGAPQPEEVAGWCNGPAGMVYLWTLAHRAFGRDEYLQLAEASAWSAWEAPGGFPDLCCGLAGRAYALLNLYRHTGDAEWLERARRLGARVHAALVHGCGFAHPMSLFKGETGMVLLGADLATPEEARMPFFEPEGWPVADA